MRGRRTGLLAGLDMYRKVPVDLLEGSKEGNVVSWIAIAIIAILIIHETHQFMSTKLVTDLKLDRSSQDIGGKHNGNKHNLDKVKVNFNITMMDLKCKYATINVISVLGDEQNITKNIQRWDIDAEGVQQQLARTRNPDQKDIIQFDPSVTQSLEKLHANGEDAVELDPDTFEYALEDYEFVFVNFFASWCGHCKRLHPTWERFAEIMNDAVNKKEHKEDYDHKDYEEAAKLDEPVLVAKVDCVKYDYLCDEHGIDGFPTLKLYVNGALDMGGEYEGDRTILSFIQALINVEADMLKDDTKASTIKEHASAAMMKHLNMTQDHKDWLTTVERTQTHYETTGGIWNKSEHPGCLMVGELELNRVPGRFFIQAQGQATGRNLDPRMTNLSHEITHLSFQRTSKLTAAEKRGAVVPPNYGRTIHPFDGNVYVTEELHQAYHHYIKLVSTNHEYYQVLQNSQLSFYPPDRIPEAKFVLDISPIAVHYRSRKKKEWYDYVTSLLAIIGGTFTVLGMFDTIVHRFASKARRKSSMRNLNVKSAP